MGFLEERRPLKRFIFACSVGYFLLIILEAVMEGYAGIKGKPHPERFGATLLAIGGLI